jgi:glycosyltransferase involved in cell wall biosynthesis
MRIALVTRRFPPLIGGAEAMLRYLATELADQGADVTVLTARPRIQSNRVVLVVIESERDDPEGIPGRPLRIAYMDTSPLRFHGTWLYMRSLRRWFDRYPVDIAYVSMLKHDAYVAVDAGRRHGFPVVLRPEGAGATGDIAWQSWGRGGRAIARRCKQADAFVAISEAVRRELVGAGYDESRIVDLPNGVPMPAEPWSPRPDWAESPHAVFVGRLAPEKGLHALIDAWPIVRRAFPAARLTLVGEGPERPSLEARIAHLGLADAIQSPGASPDPTALLAAADLFVLPSREEGMSIALLEAMALGIPTVATAIPGNLKLVTDGVHGRLAPPDDPEGLARAIVAQWTDPEAALRMGREARAGVIERYSIAAVARAHLELFGRLARG